MSRYCVIPSCVALADEGNEYCSVHRTYCIECGFPKSQHPVVRFTENGPQIVCGKGIGEQSEAAS